MLMTRGLNEPLQETDQVIREYFDPMAHAFIDALLDAFPGSTRAQVAWAYQFMLGVLLHHIGDERVHRLSNGCNTPNDPAAAPLLAAFIAGGVRQAMATPFASPARQHSDPVSP